MTGYFLNKGSEKIQLEGETLIGRSDECDLKISEGHPSRRHAMLTIDDDGAWLEDLESANGTFVNDQRITTRCRLNSGDRISFDTNSFVFEAPAAVGDATIVRRIAEDEGATVVRAVPPAEPAAPEPSGQASASARPAPAPSAERNTAEPPPPPPQNAPPRTSEAVPRSWADPEYRNEQGTRMFTPEELKAMTEDASAAGSAPATGIEGPHLQVTKGANAGTTLVLGDDKNEWTIGTDADRDLAVTDPGVSAYHAKITREGQRWKVIDQMSANGTFVNGQKGTVSFLSSGDRLRFGPVECTVVLPAGTRQAVAPGAKAQSARKSRSNTWLIAALAALGTIALLVIVLQFV